ncbi:hypothetical protein ACFZBU_06555 [Embleya sp. NPDC008237]|uniref:hypothetical protein n=1 Tax=Embleya sp. NPDC008237 TaxID=3363978 RepID=UPI0036E750D3
MAGALPRWEFGSPQLLPGDRTGNAILDRTPKRPPRDLSTDPDAVAATVPRTDGSKVGISE